VYEFDTATVRRFYNGMLQNLKCTRAAHTSAKNKSIQLTQQFRHPDQFTSRIRDVHLDRSANSLSTSSFGRIFHP